MHRAIEIFDPLLLSRMAEALAAAVATARLSGTSPSPEAQHAMALERGQILQLLSTPQSAAEISARLRLPLGVARVVLGDLVDEGYLALNTRSATGRPDLRLLERVLDGLQAL